MMSPTTAPTEDAPPKDASADAAGTRPSHASLRVMTFNVLYHGAENAAGDWPTRRHLVTEVLAQWRPDVVGFQEATALQLEHLTADHPEYVVLPGPVSGATRLPYWLRRGERVQDAGEYCPLLYRRDRLTVTAQGAFWLSPRSDEAGSVLFGTWLPRVVNWARFEEVGSLPPPSPPLPPSPNAGRGGSSVGEVSPSKLPPLPALGEGGRGGEGDSRTVSVFNTHIDFLPWAAHRSAQILWARLKQYWDGTPQIVMGDFNAAPGSAIHRCLLRDCPRYVGTPTFRDAYDAATHRKGPVETFHAGRGRRRWPGRIDHIFFRPTNLHVTQCVTITHGRNNRFPSDHYPVMAEFGRWPSPSSPPV